MTLLCIVSGICPKQTKANLYTLLFDKINKVDKTQQNIQQKKLTPKDILKVEEEQNLHILGQYLHIVHVFKM